MLYRYGRNDRAYASLLEIAGDSFFGKDQGEVAFAVIGAVATGLMGLTPDGPKSTVETLPRLAEALKWAKLAHVPVLRNEIVIEHRGIRESTFTNSAGPAIQWKIAFPLTAPVSSPSIVVDGVPTAAAIEWRPDRQPVVSTVVPVAPGKSRTASYRG